jgi:RING-box protein 1
MTSHFKIEEVCMVGKVGEELSSETHCSICRNHLEENSIYDNSIIPNKIERGVCNHVFHHECIKRWITTNVRCPNCFNKWNYK